MSAPELPSVSAEPFVLRCSGPNFLKRLFAHLLIRLLIFGTLPAPLQLHALAFPASLLWSLPQLELVGERPASTPSDAPALGTPDLVQASIYRPEWGSGIVDYANDNPTRFVDPTGHDNVLALGKSRMTPEQRLEQERAAAASERAIKNLALGWGERAFDAAAGLLKQGVKGSVALAFPPLLIKNSIENAKGLYHAGESVVENYKLVRDAPPGATMEAIAELGEEESVRIIGGATFDTQAVVAGADGVVSWRRGLLKRGAAPLAEEGLGAAPNPRHVAQAGSVDDLDALLTKLSERAVRHGDAARSAGAPGLNVNGRDEARLPDQ